MRNPYRISIPTQTGAVLLVSLIMLVLLTIIGVVAVNTSILETKMAKNLQEEVVAFNRAESALRDGEAFIESTILDPNQNPFPFSTTTGAYDTALDDITPDPISLSDIDWEMIDPDNDHDPIQYSETDGTVIGRYIIEYLGTFDREGESASASQNPPVSGSKVYLFRVTAKGLANASGTEKIVRSVYAALDSPT